MAVTTPVCSFGWPAVDFQLADATGAIFSLADIRGKRGTLIMFICNHCPYVRAVAESIAKDARKLQKAEIGVAAIMSNDYRRFPEDAPEKMLAFARQHGFAFPYLIDESQSVARDYGAVCTPDFFGFNVNLQLQYRGRLDASRTERLVGARRELLEAMQLIAESGKGPAEQMPSMGCSIKWQETP